MTRFKPGTVIKIIKGGKYFNKIFLITDFILSNYYCIQLTRNFKIDKRIPIGHSYFSNSIFNKILSADEFNSCIDYLEGKTGDKFIILKENVKIETVL